jgi:hypothetical protein
MMARVAVATGRSLFALAEVPLHEVVYEFLRMQEVERIEGLQRRKQAIDDAYLTMYAVNKPTLLEAENRKLNRDLHRRPDHMRATHGALTPDVMARVNAILALDGRAAMQATQPSLPS